MHVTAKSTKRDGAAPLIEIRYGDRQYTVRKWQMER
jgi:hypothetical protein